MRRVWLLAIGTFSVGTGLFVLAGILPDMAKSFSVGQSSAGQSMTVFSIVYAIATPVLAAATASIPPRRVLVPALALFVFATAAGAIAPTFELFLGTRVIAALGAAAFSPTALGAATRLVDPARRGQALAVVMGGLNGAIGLGVPLGSLISSVAGWRSALWLVVVLGIAGLVVLPVAARDLDGGESTPVLQRLMLLKRPPVLSVLAVTTLAVTAGITAYEYIAAVLRDTAGLTGEAFIGLLVLYGVGAFVGVVAAGGISDRVGARPTVLVVLVLQVAMLAVVPLIHTPVLVAVIAPFWGASLVAITPSQQQELIEAAPHDATVAVSLNSSAIYIGQALGSAVGGFSLSQGLAAANLPYVAAGIGAAAMLLHLLIHPRARTEQPTTERTIS